MMLRRLEVRGAIEISGRAMCGSRRIDIWVAGRGAARPVLRRHRSKREWLQLLKQDVAQCNAFVYILAEGGTCKVYGPELFIRPWIWEVSEQRRGPSKVGRRWMSGTQGLRPSHLEVNYLGAVGTKMDTHC